MRHEKLIKTILLITLVADIITFGAVTSYYLYKSINGDNIIISPEEKDLTPKTFDPVDGKKRLHYKNPNPVMQAIIDNRPLSEIAALLDSGIDVNAEDNSQNTALNYAIFCENKPVIKLLLNKGGKEGDEIHNFNETEKDVIWYHFENPSVPRLLLNPEDYDDNGIITTQAIIRQSTDNETPLNILYYPCAILLFGTIIFAKHGLMPHHVEYAQSKPLSGHFRTYVLALFVIASVTVIIYFCYIFSMNLPFQYLKAHLLRDALYTVSGIAILIAARMVGFIISDLGSDH